MKKHPYVAVMEAVRESLSGEAMRLFKMKVESLKKQGEKQVDLRCPDCGMVETHSLQCHKINRRNNKPELLPCPDCGCTDVTSYSTDEFEYSTKECYYWVACDRCGAMSKSFANKDDAVMSWNSGSRLRRTSPHRILRG